MAYCTIADLLIGDIPTSAALDPSKYVNDAADEIDSKIGFRYATPVDTNSVPRPVALLLKRINSHLASGRLIMAATITTEDKRLNAYGESLVKDAEEAISQIAAGLIPLPETEESETIDSITSPPKMLYANHDSESSVNAFYERIANPDYQFVSPYFVTGGGG